MTLNAENQKPAWIKTLNFTNLIQNIAHISKDVV